MKKLFTITFFTTLFLITVPAMAVELVGVELYSNAEPFVYGYKDLNDHFKVDIWSSVPFELGATFGPTYAWGEANVAAVGFGMSFGNLSGVNKHQYWNVDVQWDIDFSRFHWRSYNLFQGTDNEEVGDFKLLRQKVTHADYPLGIVSHNTQVADLDWDNFLGPYWNFGQTGPFVNNALCLGYNLNYEEDAGNPEFWACWFLDF